VVVHNGKADTKARKEIECTARIPLLRGQATAFSPYGGI
jgi:hypothetical protein